ncbi:hypothetical protein [Cryobacterium mannosilyticum]|uniref:Uncharacterized protein n=1 Tax=Cryobacterium mannosilyticum TaxID=1259190 RepID=A0A4R8W5J0_9MICO|nr:hypothetical protein [Cryobacterium mannosilyticum]TFC01232.1 hypothetical protein E3O32_13810 [Cryobacterium mannosilyticum]
MNDFDKDVVLLHQLDRQRASMLEAVETYEGLLERMGARVQGLVGQVEEERENCRMLEADRDDACARLVQASTEVERLKAVVAEMRTSRSWRITAPIRRLSDVAWRSKTL